MSARPLLSSRTGGPALDPWIERAAFRAATFSGGRFGLGNGGTGIGVGIGIGIGGSVGVGHDEKDDNERDNRVGFGGNGGHEDRGEEKEDEEEDEDEDDGDNRRPKIVQVLGRGGTWRSSRHDLDDEEGQAAATTTTTACEAEGGGAASSSSSSLCRSCPPYLIVCDGRNSIAAFLEPSPPPPAPPHSSPSSLTSKTTNTATTGRRRRVRRASGSRRHPFLNDASTNPPERGSLVKLNQWHVSTVMQCAEGTHLEHITSPHPFPHSTNNRSGGAVVPLGPAFSTCDRCGEHLWSETGMVRGESHQQKMLGMGLCLVLPMQGLECLGAEGTPLPSDVRYSLDVNDSIDVRRAADFLSLLSHGSSMTESPRWRLERNLARRRAHFESKSAGGEKGKNRRLPGRLGGDVDGNGSDDGDGDGDGGGDGGDDGDGDGDGDVRDDGAVLIDSAGMKVVSSFAIGHAVAEGANICERRCGDGVKSENNERAVTDFQDLFGRVLDAGKAAADPGRIGIGIGGGGGGDGVPNEWPRASSLSSSCRPAVPGARGAGSEVGGSRPTQPSTAATATTLDAFAAKQALFGRVLEAAATARADADSDADADAVSASVAPSSPAAQPCGLPGEALTDFQAVFGRVADPGRIGIGGGNSRGGGGPNESSGAPSLSSSRRPAIPGARGVELEAGGSGPTQPSTAATVTTLDDFAAKQALFGRVLEAGARADADAVSASASASVAPSSQAAHPYALPGGALGDRPQPRSLRYPAVPATASGGGASPDNSGGSASANASDNASSCHQGGPATSSRITTTIATIAPVVTDARVWGAAVMGQVPPPVAVSASPGVDGAEERPIAATKTVTTTNDFSARSSPAVAPSSSSPAVALGDCFRPPPCHPTDYASQNESDRKICRGGEATISTTAAMALVVVDTRGREAGAGRGAPPLVAVSTLSGGGATAATATAMASAATTDDFSPKQALFGRVLAESGSGSDAPPSSAAEVTASASASSSSGEEKSYTETAGKAAAAVATLAAATITDGFAARQALFGRVLEAAAAADAAAGADASSPAAAPSAASPADAPSDLPRPADGAADAGGALPNDSAERIGHGGGIPISKKKTTTATAIGSVDTDALGRGVEVGGSVPSSSAATLVSSGGGNRDKRSIAMTKTVAASTTATEVAVAATRAGTANNSPAKQALSGRVKAAVSDAVDAVAFVAPSSLLVAPSVFPVAAPGDHFCPSHLSDDIAGSCCDGGGARDDASPSGSGGRCPMNTKPMTTTKTIASLNRDVASAHILAGRVPDAAATAAPRVRPYEIGDGGGGAAFVASVAEPAAPSLAPPAGKTVGDRIRGGSGGGGAPTDCGNANGGEGGVRLALSFCPAMAAATADDDVAAVAEAEAKAVEEAEVAEVELGECSDRVKRREGREVRAGSGGERGDGSDVGGARFTPGDSSVEDEGEDEDSFVGIGDMLASEESSVKPLFSDVALGREQRAHEREEQRRSTSQSEGTDDNTNAAFRFDVDENAHDKEENERDAQADAIPTSHSTQEDHFWGEKVCAETVWQTQLFCVTPAEETQDPTALVSALNVEKRPSLPDEIGFVGIRKNTGGRSALSVGVVGDEEDVGDGATVEAHPSNSMHDATQRDDIAEIGNAWRRPPLEAEAVTVTLPSGVGADVSAAANVEAVNDVGGGERSPEEQICCSLSVRSTAHTVESTRANGDAILPRRTVVVAVGEETETMRSARPCDTLNKGDLEGDIFGEGGLSSSTRFEEAPANALNLSLLSRSEGAHQSTLNVVNGGKSTNADENATRNGDDTEDLHRMEARIGGKEGIGGNSKPDREALATSCGPLPPSTESASEPGLASVPQRDGFDAVLCGKVAGEDIENIEGAESEFREESPLLTQPQHLPASDETALYDVDLNDRTPRLSAAYADGGHVCHVPECHSGCSAVASESVRNATEDDMAKAASREIVDCGNLSPAKTLVSSASAATPDRVQGSRLSSIGSVVSDLEEAAPYVKASSRKPNYEALSNRMSHGGVRGTLSECNNSRPSPLKRKAYVVGEKVTGLDVAMENRGAPVAVWGSPCLLSRMGVPSETKPELHSPKNQNRDKNGVSPLTGARTYDEAPVSEMTRCNCGTVTGRTSRSKKRRRKALDGDGTSVSKDQSGLTHNTTKRKKLSIAYNNRPRSERVVFNIGAWLSKNLKGLR